MRLSAIVYRRVASFLLLGGLSFTSLSFATTTSAPPLTLSAAEQLALTNAPELQQLAADTQALQQQAIADAQLPDPQLMAGAVNVPTDTFSFTQDDMTMLTVGLQQAFPPGHSLAIKSAQTNSLANAMQQKSQLQALQLREKVQETWLDLYYWTQALKIINANHTLLAYLLQATRSQYSVGKDSLANVLQVKLELATLSDQAISIQQQLDTLRSQLARWIGPAGYGALQLELPNWPNPPTLLQLQQTLSQHPLLKRDAANIRAATQQEAWAREQFKPGWALSVDYGVRQGDMPTANNMAEPRADMVGAQVTVDLPLFTNNRQQRRLHASADQLEAAQLQQQIDYRNLSQQLRTEYALWQQLNKRSQLYQKQLIPEAKENTQAALLAYQSATTDLNTVLRANSNERNLTLQQLAVTIARLKVCAILMYLAGSNA